MTPSNPSPDTGAGTPLTAEDALAYLLDAIDSALVRHDLVPPVAGVPETTILDAMAAWPTGANGPIAIAAHESLAERLRRLRAVTSGIKSGLVDGRPFARSRPATDPAGLDVERLRQAIDDHDDNCSSMAIPDCAERVADVVARLSVADGPGPEERLRETVALLNEPGSDGETDLDLIEDVLRSAGVLGTTLQHVLALRALPVHREEPSDD